MYHRKSDGRLTRKLRNLSVEANQLANNDRQQESPPVYSPPLLQAMPENQSSDWASP